MVRLTSIPSEVESLPPGVSNLNPDACTFLPRLRASAAAVSKLNHLAKEFNPASGGWAAPPDVEVTPVHSVQVGSKLNPLAEAFYPANGVHVGPIVPAVFKCPPLPQQTSRGQSTLVSDLCPASLANPLALASTPIESQDLIKPQMLSLPLPNSKGDLISRDASTLGSPSSIPIPPPISPSVTPNSGPCSLAEPPLLSPMVPIGLEPVVNAHPGWICMVYVTVRSILHLMCLSLFP